MVENFPDTKEFNTPEIPGGDFIVEQKESVKLSKMSKGYNWEIKIIGNPIFDDGALKRLEEIDKKLKEKFSQ